MESFLLDSAPFCCANHCTLSQCISIL